MVVRTALLVALCVVLFQQAIQRFQFHTKLWPAPSATCEGLPPYILIPVPVLIPTPKKTDA
jgi:hypothetical protein